MLMIIILSVLMYSNVDQKSDARVYLGNTD